MVNPDILLLLQTLGDGLHPSSEALIHAGLRLGKERRVCGLLMADNPGEHALRLLRESGLDRAYICTDPAFRLFRAEEHCAALLGCVERLRPQSLLVGATPEGRTLAPMLAAKMGTGVTADCTSLGYTEDGLLLQTRPAFGGDVMADIITPDARPQIATLRYSVAAGGGGQTELEYIPARFAGLETALPQAEWMERIGKQAASGDVIVALGGGFTNREETEPFAEYASALGGQLMCSRALVERGWFDRGRQIGLSGQSISPRLLLCFGLSGSVQFMAGVGGAERICAVNLDEAAPIMRSADLPIVGDMHEVILRLNN